MIVNIAELNRFRREAHEVMDQLWKSGRFSRGGAYKWLARSLGLSQAEAHISRMNRQQCELIKSKANKLLKSGAADSFQKLARTRIAGGEFKGRSFSQVPVGELQKIAAQIGSWVEPRINRYLELLQERNAAMIAEAQAADRACQAKRKRSCVRKKTCSRRKARQDELLEV